MDPPDILAQNPGSGAVMRKLFLGSIALAAIIASPAMAADMPVKAPVYQAAPAPMFNWTGFYAGLNAGYGWGNKDWELFDVVGLPIPPTRSFNVTGPFAGGQIGFNYQAGPVVFGVEGEWDWANLDGDLRDGDPNSGVICHTNFACHTKIRSVATATGRLGLTWDSALLYVKGGGAWASEQHRFIVVASGADLASANETRSGWLLGGGIEYGFFKNWSAKAEYNYIDFGSRHLIFNPGSFDVQIKERIQIIKFGINYRFDWGMGPVSAKY
jgi:outer membrane immunogenic protein